LHERRQTRERELRHAALQTKHNERLRNDEPAAAVTLSHAEVIAIREQLDQEMPLQYVTPQYLEQHEDAELTADGQFMRAANLAADDGTQPGGAGGAHPDAAHHDATQGAGGGAGAAPGATSGATPGTDTTADTTAQDGETAGGGGGGRGGGAIRTGLAAAAGAIIGHELAEHHQGHHDAHDDSFALDEDAAGRIFAAASDVDIDNLSRRLWSRIRREMRTELLVDRERAGSLADIR
jgi:hypothetical protein